MLDCKVGSQEHYQEYLKSRRPFIDYLNETPLTYEQFVESVTADED